MEYFTWKNLKNHVLIEETPRKIQFAKKNKTVLLEKKHDRYPDRPSTSKPSISLMARSAASEEANFTNPKPLGPVPGRVKGQYSESKIPGFRVLENCVCYFVSFCFD